MLLKNKRGQFYLIAAVVIVGIMIGFATIKNTLAETSSGDVKIYFMSEELDFESGSVLDYGYSNSKEIDPLLEGFTNTYSDLRGEGTEIYFLYGNEDSMTLYNYQGKKVEKGYVGQTVSEDTIARNKIYEKVKSDSKGIPVNPGNSQTAHGISVANNRVLVRFREQEYEFDLKQGEGFYFIIQQEVNGNVFTVKK
jgi:hypothetical protein